MCNRYVSPDALDIERLWHVGGRQGHMPWRRQEVFPRAAGAFIRAPAAAATDDMTQRELVVGQWGLVPFFAKSPKLRWSTNNARSEELAQKATFKLPWARGQRCIIPAESFDEPCWETGRNVWWRFRRSDGRPWGLAGLWNTWTDKDTGELVESYTMLTINADRHPLMSRMHKPDPALAPEQQDKRSVISVELRDVDLWLGGSLDDASALLTLPPVEVFDARPAVPTAGPAGSAGSGEVG